MVKISSPLVVTAIREQLIQFVPQSMHAVYYIRREYVLCNVCINIIDIGDLFL